MFEGNEGVNDRIEGGKLYKGNGFYYVFGGGGGVVWGWEVVMGWKDV